MRRSQIVYQLFCLSVDPAVEKAAARKDESVCPVIVDNGQLNIAVKRSTRYWLPLHIEIV